MPEALGWAETVSEALPEMVARGDMDECGLAEALGWPELLALGSSETVSEELPEEVPLSCGVADAQGLPESPELEREGRPEDVTLCAGEADS